MKRRLAVSVVAVGLLALCANATAAAPPYAGRVLIEQAAVEPYRTWAQRYADQSLVPMPHTTLEIRLMYDPPPDWPEGEGWPFGSFSSGSDPAVQPGGPSHTLLFVGRAAQGKKRDLGAGIFEGFLVSGFTHELGHTLWNQHLPVWAKERFQIIMRDPRPWDASWEDAPGTAYAGDTPPEEHFADAFSLVARKHRIRKVYVGGYDTRITPQQFRRVRRLILQTAEA